VQGVGLQGILGIMCHPERKPLSRDYARPAHPAAAADVPLRVNMRVTQQLGPIYYS
jgi:hypothetical protein